MFRKGGVWKLRVHGTRGLSGLLLCPKLRKKEAQNKANAALPTNKQGPGYEQLQAGSSEERSL